jgi:WD40 repeat protein
VLAVAFSPDGKTVLTAGGRAVRLWEVATGKPLGKSLPQQRDRVLAAAFSPDGKTVLVGMEGGSAQRWDIANAKLLGPPLLHNGWVISVAFSPDGRFILTGSTDQTARLWEVATGQSVGSPLHHGGWARAVAFSPDGNSS